MSQQPDTTADALAAPAPDTTFLPWLDARHRAMLAEMGVRIWAPKGPAAPASEARAGATTAERAPTPARPAAAAPPAPLAAAPARPPPQPLASPAAAPLLTAADTSPPPVARVPMDGIEAMDWATLRATVADCRACSLCEGRTQTVFGTGDEQADWMVVGEAPGDPEDRQGEPYLGDAGRLLDNMLHAVGRSRTGQGDRAAYVAHVLKCRPSTRHSPQAAEVALCAQYLARQVALVQPRVIIAMGPLAAQALLQSQDPIGRLRGHVHRYQDVPVIVTFPPSHLLRSPANKGKAWADLCLAMEQLKP